MPLGEKHRVSQLQFLLHSRPVHPEFFDIHYEQRIAKPAYDAQIWVTGVSHVIGFYHGATSLVELIADSETPLPETGRLVTIPFRGEKDYDLVHGPIRYRMNFQVETLNARLYAKVHEDLTAQAAQKGLFVPFPQWTANGLVPFTYLDYQSKADQLHVFAYHAFVDELTLIKTQSIFELSDEPA
jgi:hypothetical protein